MTSEQPEFPDDVPQAVEENLSATYDNFELERLVRGVGGDPLGGGVWVSEDTSVTVMSYHDGWAVEAHPMDWEDERRIIYAYKGNDERQLSREEAYQLADEVLSGEVDLETEHRGQQSVADYC